MGLPSPSFKALWNRNAVVRDKSIPQALPVCYETTAEVEGFEFSVCSSWTFCASDVVIGTMTSRICAAVMAIESAWTFSVIEISFLMKDKIGWVNLVEYKQCMYNFTYVRMT